MNLWIAIAALLLWAFAPSASAWELDPRFGNPPFYRAKPMTHQARPQAFASANQLEIRLKGQGLINDPALTHKGGAGTDIAEMLAYYVKHGAGASHAPPHGSTTGKNAGVEQAGPDDPGEA